MEQLLGPYGFSIMKSHLEDMFYSSKEILLLVKHNMSRSVKSVGEMHCTVLYVPRYWVGCRLQVSANRIKNYCLEDEYTHFGKIQFHSLRRAALSGTIHIRGLGVKAEWAPCPDACLCFSSVVSLQLLLPLPIQSSWAHVSCCLEEGETMANCLSVPPFCPPRLVLPVLPFPSVPSVLASKAWGQVCDCCKKRLCSEMCEVRALEWAALQRQPELVRELGAMPWDLPHFLLVLISIYEFVVFNT